MQKQAVTKMTHVIEGILFTILIAYFGLLGWRVYEVGQTNTARKQTLAATIDRPKARPSTPVVITEKTDSKHEQTPTSHSQAAPSPRPNLTFTPPQQQTPTQLTTSPTPESKHEPETKKEHITPADCSQEGTAISAWVATEQTVTYHNISLTTVAGQLSLDTKVAGLCYRTEENELVVQANDVYIRADDLRLMQ